MDKCIYIQKILKIKLKIGKLYTNISKKNVFIGPKEYVYA